MATNDDAPQHGHALLQRLLNSFEEIHSHPKSFWNCSEDIAALRAALEQPATGSPDLLRELADLLKSVNTSGIRLEAGSDWCQRVDSALKQVEALSPEEH